MSGSVLDVGCGAQPFRHLLSGKCVYRGIDSARALIDFGPRFPDTTYFDGDQWPVGDESVDYVLSTETMEHVLESNVFLQEAHRCLRPGGQIILTVPFSARWHFIPHDYWRFTPSALEWLLTQAGFRDVKVHARGNAVTVAAYKVMSVILTASLGRNASGTSFSAGRLMGRLLGIVAFPLVPLFAIVGQLSLLGEGGDDCLGYTVIGYRRNDSPRDHRKSAGRRSGQSVPEGSTDAMQWSSEAARTSPSRMTLRRIYRGRCFTSSKTLARYSPRRPVPKTEREPNSMMANRTVVRPSGTRRATRSAG